MKNNGQSDLYWKMEHSFIWQTYTKATGWQWWLRVYQLVRVWKIKKSRRGIREIIEKTANCESVDLKIKNANAAILPLKRNLEFEILKRLSGPISGIYTKVYM